MKISLWQWIAVYALTLSIVLFIFSARLDESSLPVSLLTANILLALVLAGVATAVVVFFVVLVLGLLKNSWRRLLSFVAVFAIRKCLNDFSTPLVADSIGERRGNLVIRLPLGKREGADSEQVIRAINEATGEVLGYLEFLEIDENSSLCIVSDRIAIDFWEDLEGRKRKDFRPPPGVLFSRNVPEGYLQYLEMIVSIWREKHGLRG